MKNYFHALTLTLLAICTCVQSQRKATVEIQPADGNYGASGTLWLEETNHGHLQVKGEIKGLNPQGGLHGFHVHEKGDLGNKCVAAGPHFNPFKNEHGAPDDTKRHVGDFGNIRSHNGVAQIDYIDTLASLDSTSDSYIGGRAIVIHEKEDDLGKGYGDESKKTGNAGKRIGCGIIKVDGHSSAHLPTATAPVQLAIGCIAGVIMMKRLF